MIVENPAALNYLFDEEVFLLASEKDTLTAPQQVIEPAPVQPEAPVATPAVSEPVEVEITKPFEPKFLGKNAKRFLITTYYPQHDHIHPDHLTALSAVLKRLQFEADDVAIINLYNHANAGYEKLAAFFSPAKLLILGEKAIPAGSDVKAINKIEPKDSHAMLYTFSFDEMMTDVDKKRQFWEQIKNL